MFTTENSSAIIIPFNAATPTPSATNQSFEAFKESWQLQIAADKSLPAGALRVALAIFAHMNRQQNGLAWPGYNRLARMLGLHRITVITNVKRLEKAGHLSVKRRRTGSKNAPNEYRPKLKGGSSAATLLPPIPPSSADATTLVAQLRNHPSSAATLPEPLNEPLNEPLIKKEREARHSGSPTPPNTKPIIQTELVAEEGKAGTLTTIAQPSLPRNRSLRGKRLPEDWGPLPEDAAFACNLLGDSGFATTLENFRDYWLSRADAGAVKLDWSRTWKIWCRKDAERRPMHSGNITVAEAQERIIAKTATASDVRMLKDHHKLEYGLMLKGMRSPETRRLMEEFINPRRRPDHDGPTIDAEVTEVVPPAELPAPATETEAHSEEHREKMRGKLQSLRIELKERNK